ncbi:MAG TPA: tetratricopeptide repeat protein [Patescibacteria group bacterium]|nr:tetratricopeptide repeat protein [Patescibacteria group bacterium]
MSVVRSTARCAAGLALAATLVRGAAGATASNATAPGAPATVAPTPGAPAPAAPARDAPAPRPTVPRGSWLRVETPDFTLLGEVPEARLRLIAGRLETFRSALEGLHPGSLPSPRETTLYVFKEAKSAWPFTSARAQGDRHLEVNQQYDVPNFVILAAPMDDPPLEVLYHSYAHQFLDDNFPRLPLTIDEGLAEFDTGFAVMPEGSAIGMVNADHVRWLRHNPNPPLAELFALDARSATFADPGSREAFVAGSWALMHYLVSGSGGMRPLLPLFLAALQRGTPAPQAAQSTLGVSLDELQQRVAQYVQGDRFLALRVRGQAADGGAAAPRGDAIHARPMGPDEVIAVLGDLLGHAGADKAADAEIYYRQALQWNLAQERAEAGLGYLRYSRNDFAGAIPFFDKAIAIEPDAMTCYLLARSLLKTNSAGSVAPPPSPPPPWLARVRDLLTRAIALRPHFAAPYVALGATQLLPDGDAPSGVSMLQQAHRMLPARLDISGNLVYLLLRMGDLARAQSVVDDAIVPSGDQAAIKSARAALSAFKADLAAHRSVERATRQTAIESLSPDSVEKSLETLRGTLDKTTDPVARAGIEQAIRKLEEQTTAQFGNQAAAIYNEAVGLANKRDYPKAIKLLEDLLPKVQDPGLHVQIESLLERFRQDAAHVQQPVQ